MATGVAAAPDPDPLPVHRRHGADIGDGVPVVADLSPGIDLLTGLTITGAEAAIVEHQHIQPGRGKHLGEAVEVHLLDRGKAVRHDDGGARRCAPLSLVEPAPQGDALGVKLNISPTHPSLLSPGFAGPRRALAHPGPPHPSLGGTAPAVQHTDRRKPRHHQGDVHPGPDTDAVLCRAPACACSRVLARLLAAGKAGHVPTPV